MKKAKVILEVPAGTDLPLKVRLEGSSFPFWQWLEVPPGREIAVVCCADSVLTYLCHYLSGNYVPCGHNWNLECSQHRDGESVRTIYQGSVPVIKPAGGRVYLLNPTAACLRSGSPALDSRQDLLGRKLIVGRRHGGRNAKMYWHDTQETRASLQGKGFTAGEIWRVQLNLWGVELRASDNWRQLAEKYAESQACPTDTSDVSDGPGPRA